jgi:hypothetical protein
MKTRKNNPELSSRQKDFIKDVVSDPLLFTTHILGIDL